MTEQQETERLARVNERIAMLKQTRADTIAAGYDPALSTQWVGAIDVMTAALTQLRDVLRFNLGYDCETIPTPSAHDGIVEEPDVRTRLDAMRRHGSSAQNIAYETARLEWLSGHRSTKPTPEEFGAVDYSVLNDIPRISLTNI